MGLFLHFLNPESTMFPFLVLQNDELSKKRKYILPTKLLHCVCHANFPRDAADLQFFILVKGNYMQLLTIQEFFHTSKDFRL